MFSLDLTSGAKCGISLFNPSFLYFFEEKSTYPSGAITTEVGSCSLPKFLQRSALELVNRQMKRNRSFGSGTLKRSDLCLFDSGLLETRTSSATGLTNKLQTVSSKVYHCWCLNVVLSTKSLPLSLGPSQAR